MSRKTFNVLAVVTVVLAVVAAATVAANAEHGGSQSITASFCVDDAGFHFDIQLDNIHLQDGIGNGGIFFDADSAVSGESVVMNYNASGTNTVVFTGVTPLVAQNPVPGLDRWVDGPIVGSIISGSLEDGGVLFDTWDISWSGTIAEGTEPLVAGDDVALVEATNWDPVGQLSIANVPVTACEVPSTTTTSSSTTTTTMPSTTTTTSSTTTTTMPSTTTTSSSTTTTSSSTTTTTMPSTTTTTSLITTTTLTTTPPSSATTSIVGASTLPLTGDEGSGWGESAAVLVTAGAVMLLLAALNLRRMEEGSPEEVQCV